MWVFNANAQIDKDNFEEIFDQEVSDSKYSDRSSHSGTYQHVVPQQVPSWFINIPVSQDNDVFSIGISDPEMDSTAGMEMAIYRAQIMANVLSKSTTQLLCDFFLNEVDNSTDVVYEHFSRINAKIPKNGKFDIIESYTNKFDETVALIKYYPSQNVKNNEVNRIMLELYKNEIESTAHGSFESIFELWVRSAKEKEPDPMFYQLTEFGKRHDVVSAQNNIQKEIPIYKLCYTGLPRTDSAAYTYFSHGLWKEYFKSIMTQIIFKAREKPENISYISDSYQKNSLEKLTRGISVNKMRFTLVGISTNENRLKVNMKELPLDN